MKDFWNDRYGQNEYIYGKKPNIFFAEQIALLEPGKLLLPAEGEGRNAIYAAGLDWEVTAFDFSEAAKDKAEKLASEVGLSINYQISQVNDFQSEAASFDVIALIYAHFPIQVRKPFHQKLVNWLRPGGRIILEAFTPRQLERSSGGPKNSDMLYDQKIVSSDFAALKKIVLEENTIQLSEGKFHKGEAEVIRYVGEKN